jgi:hypothetical protein
MWTYVCRRCSIDAALRTLLRPVSLATVVTTRHPGTCAGYWRAQHYIMWRHAQRLCSNATTMDHVLEMFVLSKCLLYADMWNLIYQLFILASFEVCSQHTIEVHPSRTASGKGFHCLVREPENAIIASYGVVWCVVVGILCTVTTTRCCRAITTRRTPARTRRLWR